MVPLTDRGQTTGSGRDKGPFDSPLQQKSDVHVQPTTGSLPTSRHSHCFHGLFGVTPVPFPYAPWGAEVCPGGIYVSGGAPLRRERGIVVQRETCTECPCPWETRGVSTEGTRTAGVPTWNVRKQVEEISRGERWVKRTENSTASHLLVTRMTEPFDARVGREGSPTGFFPVFTGVPL